MLHQTIALFTALTSTIALADTHQMTYDCTDAVTGNRAELSVSMGGAQEIYWSEPWHSAESDGEFLGLEQAPFSPWLGFAVFQLSDFFSTEDSSYKLALKRLPEGKMDAVVYFDNDDHDEEVTNYSCVAQSR